MTNDPTSLLQPLLLSAKGVSALLGVSERTVWNLHQDGQLGPLPLSLRGTTRWKTEEIVAWVQADCPSRADWLDMKKKMSRNKKILLDSNVGER